MPGFLVSNIDDEFQMTESNSDDNVIEGFIDGIYHVNRNTLNKFINDKVFYHDEDSIIITEGVILNKKFLMQKYDSAAFSDTIKKMYAENGKTFFNEFRGVFSGAFYDKKKCTWLFYCNQVGEATVFFYRVKEKFIVASSVNYIIDYLIKNHISYTLDEVAVYDMLTYGFMGSDNGTHTFIKEVKRLEAGCFIEVGDEWEIKQYHRFTNENVFPDTMSEQEMIDLIDQKFKNAVKLEYDKDLEYGYEHLASLSGGLDSRMNTWVAVRSGYKNLLNICFCQSGYLDQSISQAISKYLGTRYLYKSLDDAAFIYDVDEIIKKNYGLANYFGSAHEKSMFDCIDFRRFGLVHSGQVGDAILGTLNSVGHQIAIQENTGKYSVRLAHNSSIDKEKYPNNEMYALYSRGFRGALAGQIAMTGYTEMVSPFLDVDFLELCLKIPIAKRFHHKIYKKWILDKYPDAAKFKWEKTGTYITASSAREFICKCKKYGVSGLLDIIISRRKKVSFSHKKPSAKGMNPTEFWYQTMPEVKEYMDTYISNGLKNKYIDDAMRKDMEELARTGTALEKMQIMSALSAINLYFGM